MLSSLIIVVILYRFCTAIHMDLTIIQSRYLLDSVMDTTQTRVISSNEGYFVIAWTHYSPGWSTYATTFDKKGNIITDKRVIATGSKWYLFRDAHKSLNGSVAFVMQDAWAHESYINMIYDPSMSVIGSPTMFTLGDGAEVIFQWYIWNNGAHIQGLHDGNYLLLFTHGTRPNYNDLSQDDAEVYVRIISYDNSKFLSDPILIPSPCDRYAWGNALVSKFNKTNILITYRCYNDYTWYGVIYYYNHITHNIHPLTQHFAVKISSNTSDGVKVNHDFIQSDSLSIGGYMVVSATRLQADSTYFKVLHESGVTIIDEIMIGPGYEIGHCIVKEVIYLKQQLAPNDDDICYVLLLWFGKKGDIMYRFLQIYQLNFSLLNVITGNMMILIHENSSIVDSALFKDDYNVIADFDIIDNVVMMSYGGWKRSGENIYSEMFSIDISNIYIPPTTPETLNPTLNPTLHPSIINPTTNPSTMPSRIPTHIPTSKPTSFPTRVPTNKPTLTPTGTPTNIPTFKPTLFPTFIPTLAATTKPTLAPTRVPTHKPSFDPTLHPSTNKQTLRPSSNPTNDPTSDPNIDPTSNPYEYPTYDPTHTSSIKPTYIPTYNATKFQISNLTKSSSIASTGDDVFIHTTDTNVPSSTFISSAFNQSILPQNVDITAVPTSTAIILVIICSIIFLIIIIGYYVIRKRELNETYQRVTNREIQDNEDGPGPGRVM